MDFFRIEINDNECNCSYAQITSLINFLNGFTNLVYVNINDNEQIGNVIIMIKKKLELENNYSAEKHKELSIIELKERNFCNEIIEEWINYI